MANEEYADLESNISLMGLSLVGVPCHPVPSPTIMK